MTTTIATASARGSGSALLPGAGRSPRARMTRRGRTGQAGLCRRAVPGHHRQSEHDSGGGVSRHASRQGRLRPSDWSQPSADGVLTTHRTPVLQAAGRHHRHAQGRRRRVSLAGGAEAGEYVREARFCRSPEAARRRLAAPARPGWGGKDPWCPPIRESSRLPRRRDIAPENQPGPGPPGTPATSDRASSPACTCSSKWLRDRTGYRQADLPTLPTKRASRWRCHPPRTPLCTAATCTG